MKNMTDTISRYVSAWDEQTPEAIKAAFTECCAPEITYTDRNAPTYTYDPAHLVRGIDALTALAVGSQAKIPGRTFSIRTTPQYFDGHCHYSWGLNIPDQVVKAGWDYIRYNKENLITEIIGFLPEQP